MAEAYKHCTIEMFITIKHSLAVLI
jgi:hypothetical protein